MYFYIFYMLLYKYIYEGGQRMALLDKKAPVATEATDAKKEAAERFRKNRAAKRKAALEAALKLRDELTKAGLFDKLSAESKEYIAELCAVKPATGGSSVMTQLFGDNPKVGDKVTLEEAFNKTYKGKASIDIIVRRWEKNGIIIEYTQAPKMLESTYTIKALP